MSLTTQLRSQPLQAVTSLLTVLMLSWTLKKPQNRVGNVLRQCTGCTGWCTYVGLLVPRVTCRAQPSMPSPGHTALPMTQR